MEAAVEFERLRSLITRESQSSMPDSVRSRYERRLTALRNQLQEERHPYPLGTILVSIGAITDEQLNRALATQRTAHPHKLLGELLVDLGCIPPRMLAHALSIQRTPPSTGDAPPVGNRSE